MGFFVYAMLAILVGLLVGRWWTIGIPALAATVWAWGASREAWGSGLGDSWEAALGLVAAVCTVGVFVGVMMRKSWSRRRIRRSVS